MKRNITKQLCACLAVRYLIGVKALMLSTYGANGPVMTAKEIPLMRTPHSVNMLFGPNSSFKRNVGLRLQHGARLQLCYIVH